MDFKTQYGTYRGCRFIAAHYGNGNLALQVMNEADGPICTCTVNPGEEVRAGSIAVKDYSENAGMADTLKELGIIQGEPVEVIPSGWVQIPVYKLTEKGQALWKT